MTPGGLAEPSRPGPAVAEGASMYLEALKRARSWVDLESASLQEAMEIAAPQATGRLVDVGCCDKPYEALFAPYVREYVGVEYAPTYEAGEGARRGKADVVYSSDRLPFDDGSFDTVLCNQVAEHVPDPRVFLADLARVLRVGGKLILTVPFSFRVHSAPNDFHRFTRCALERSCADLGLHVERLTPRGFFWSVVGQKLASHFALRVARLGRDVQGAGALTYEPAMRQRPRYWTLPVAVPAIVAIATAARLLDVLDPDDSDTLGYLLIATKR
jgi:SAM-dependent methyltransferase